MIDGPGPRVVVPRTASGGPNRAAPAMTARPAGAVQDQADGPDRRPQDDDQAAAWGRGPARDGRLPRAPLGSRRAGQLAPEPQDRIVMPVHDALFQGNDGIVGDRDLLGADFG